MYIENIIKQRLNCDQNIKKHELLLKLGQQKLSPIKAKLENLEQLKMLQKKLYLYNNNNQGHQLTRISLIRINQIE